MNKKRVAVLYGGLSAEREISLKSGKNIYDALSPSFKDVKLIDVVGVSIVEDLRKFKPDIAVIALHGSYGEDGVIQGLLEMMRIPYTGSGVTASAILFDKLIAKQILLGAGILTPKYVLATEDMKKAPFLPCVVKPSRQGSSVGVSIVKSDKSFKDAIKEAFKYDSKVIIEEFIVGKEITIPIMNDTVYPPIWIRPKKGFYDYKNKYTVGMTEYLLDTKLSQSRLEKLSDLTLDIYNLFGCRSMSRVDFIVTDRKFYCIEINTLPGMTATSLVPQSLAKVGIDFNSLCMMIALSAELDNCKK